jgi:DNA-directed RNA polymerase sigma subunit (sigma70/sigma32)
MEEQELNLKFQAAYTLEEVAEKLGITKEAARQLERQALKKLKHPSLREKWQAIIDTVNELNREDKND